jgi:hypothetical protein
MVAAMRRRYRDGMENRPIVRRTIIVAILCLGVAMAGMLALGLALYRT